MSKFPLQQIGNHSNEEKEAHGISQATEVATTPHRKRQCMKNRSYKPGSPTNKPNQSIVIRDGTAPN